MKFFIVKSCRFWGDYGSMLTNGFARKGASDDAPIQLFRTGPFIPPISFPTLRTVVSDQFRSLLEQERQFNFEFRKVIKHHISKLHWETWDRTRSEPVELPKGGEPEGYVLNHWHSRTAARQMGEIWELLLPRGAITDSRKFLKREPGQRRWQIMVDPNTWDGSHFFKSKNQGWVVVSPIGADWLHEHCGDWISLEQCIPWQPKD